MFYLPVSILLFILLLLVFPFIWFFLTLDVVQIAVAKLGFSTNDALFLFAAIIIGSTINIPLYKVESQVEVIDNFSDLWVRQFFGIPLPKIRSQTIVALNVGGGLIPVLVALHQFRHANLLAIILVTVIVTMVSYYAAHVVPGIGIQMNPLLAPLTASIAAAFITRGIHAAPVAFAGGVLGTLIGADILHLKEIQRMTPGVLSIGGAGVFDGIALCGLFALLLS
jgi:uncharacterized membrane protein